MKIVETYFKEDVADSINPKVRGSKESKILFSVTEPTKKEVEESKEYGCEYIQGGYYKTILYFGFDETKIDHIQEVQDGVEIYYAKYELNEDGETFLSSETRRTEEGNIAQTQYDCYGRRITFKITYPNGDSDGESYEYGEDEIGAYIITYYYTNEVLLPDSTKVYDN